MVVNLPVAEFPRRFRDPILRHLVRKEASFAATHIHPDAVPEPDVPDALDGWAVVHG
jgi:hypothetical protein